MRRRLGGEVTWAAAAFLLYAAVSTAATWPLARHLSRGIWGDVLDPWQTFWGFWWLHRSAEHLTWPFATKLLWWPTGASLWFQSWDLPSAGVACAVWGVIDPFVTYNLLLLATFPLAGVSFYLLAKHLWSSRPAALLAGAVYTFSTFHFGHAVSHLHLASMEWTPLTMLFLYRLDEDRYASAVLLGTFAALAFLASVYHVLFLFLCVVCLALGGAFGRSGARRPIAKYALAAGVFAILAGWQIAGMARQYLMEPYAGQHDALRFSADALAYVLPNEISFWSDRWPQWQQWSGNMSETAVYVGYVTIGLAIAGARREVRSRPYLAVAAIGAVLSLGPRLHVGGTVYPWAMPEAWLVSLLPALDFSGLPVRFSWLWLFGLSIAAGGQLAYLWRGGRKRRLLAVVCVIAALCENWPKTVSINDWKTPSVFTEWRDDPREWAVLDNTGLSRSLWNQTVHGHPLVDGYMTRFPARLPEMANRVPVLAALLNAPFGAAGRGTFGGVASQARLDLARLGVRFVVVENGNGQIPTQIGLAERWRDDAIIVYEVPAQRPEDQ